MSSSENLGVFFHDGHTLLLITLDCLSKLLKTSEYNSNHPLEYSQLKT